MTATEGNGNAISMTFFNHKASEELSNNQGAKTKGPVDRKRFMSVSADCAAPVGEAARPAVGGSTGRLQGVIRSIPECYRGFFIRVL